MAKKIEQKEFTPPTKCGNCQNVSPLEVVCSHSTVQERWSEDPSDHSWEEGSIFNLCKCPACDKINLLKADWHSGYMDGSEVIWEILYPVGEKLTRGLPPKIDSGYKAALKVRSIDANAYGVLLGRVLDAVCEDRGAAGDTLDRRLRDLAAKGEIPDKLVKVAAGLRKLRNIGAHANLGELTQSELPVLDNLTRAILEYVYTAPLLATEAEERLARLGRRSP